MEKAIWGLLRYAETCGLVEQEDRFYALNSIYGFFNSCTASGTHHSAYFILLHKCTSF